MRYQATVGDRTYTLEVSGGASAVVELDGERHAVELMPELGTTHLRARVDGRWHPVVVREDAEGLWVELGGDRHRVRVERAFPIPATQTTSGGHGQTIEVKAPMPGLIVAVDVAPGVWIDQGHPVVTMEAMKMQMEIRAPARGRVLAVRVQAGQEVPGAFVLITLDSSAAASR